MERHVETRHLALSVVCGVAISALITCTGTALFHSALPAAVAVPAAFIGGIWISTEPGRGQPLFARAHGSGATKLDDIVVSYPYPAFAVGENGKIVAWNHLLETLTWIRAEDAIGEDRARLVLSQLGKIKPALIDGGAKDYPEASGPDAERPERDLVIGIDCDGTERIYAVRPRPIFDEGRRIGMIETFIDITEYYGRALRTEYLESLQQAILDLAPNGVHVVDEQWRTFACNDQFLQIWGLPSGDVSYRWYPWLQVSEDFLSRVGEPLKYFHDISDIYSFHKEPSYHIVDMKDGRKVEQRSVPVVIGNSVAGRVWSYTAMDSEKEQAIMPSSGERDALLKELHHRVKNNLQIICSLQNLQYRGIEDRLSKKMFRRCQDRIKSMALIYENLEVSGEGASVDFNDYLRMLTLHLFSSYNVRTGRVALKTNIPPIELSIDHATLCGLIVGELVANSLLHAFPGDTQGEICIDVRSAGDLIAISVADNGIGFPRNINYRDTPTLGLQIVNCLTEQLNGYMHMYNDAGTKFEITFTK